MYIYIYIVYIYIHKNHSCIEFLNYIHRSIPTDQVHCLPSYPPLGRGNSEAEAGGEELRPWERDGNATNLVIESQVNHQ